MASLQEEFEAYKATHQQSKAFQLEQEYAAYKRDMEQGGSIRTAPIEPNFPVGATVGAIAGGFTNPMLVPLFAAGGEAVQQLVERAAGSPTAPRSTGEAALRMGQEAVLSGVAEGAGQVIGKAMHGGAFAGSLDPAALKARQFLDSKGMHGGLLPAELTTTRILDIAQNVSEFSLLGGGAIRKFKDNREAFFRDLADEIIDHYGPRMSADDAGRAVIDATRRNLELDTLPAKLIYTAIDRYAAPTYYEAIQSMKVARQVAPIEESAIKKMTVKKKETAGSPEKEVETGVLDAQGTPITKTEDAVDPELRGMKVRTTYQNIQVGEQLERLKVMTTTQERQMSGARINLSHLKDELSGMTDVARRAGGLADREMGNTLLQFLAEKPDLVSYPVAKAIRTEIRTLKDTLQHSVEAKNAPAIGKAAKAYDEMTQAIRSGLEDYDPFVADMWDQANSIERAGQQQFNSRIIRSIVKRGDMEQGGKPEAIAEAIWRNNNATVIGKVRAAVDVSDWKKQQSIYLQQLFAKSSDEHGTPLAKKLQQNLFGPGGLGKKAVEAGFDGATVQELEDFIGALRIAQERQAEGTGRMLIQLKQGGAFLELSGAALAAFGMSSDSSSAPEIVAGGTILLTPLLLGHIMTNPNGIRWLTEGFSTLKHAPKAAALAAKIGLALTPRPDIERDVTGNVESRPSLTMPHNVLQQ